MSNLSNLFERMVEAQASSRRLLAAGDVHEAAQKELNDALEADRVAREELQDAVDRMVDGDDDVSLCGSVRILAEGEES